MQFKYFRKAAPIAFFAFLILPAAVRAQQEDFDQYKLRIDTFWFYSNPSGAIEGTAADDSSSVNFQRDLGFNSYSTFTAKVDWKFTRKNHFYVSVSPFYKTRQTTLTRSFTFQGQTFDVGLVTRSDIHALLVAPGYQYDIIRRKRGHLGIGIEADLFNTTAKISAAAQIVGGEPHDAVTAKGSLLAPIPVAGPEFRIYLTDSPRLFIEGNLHGMYLFGYGNFVSTADGVGVTLNKHISLNAGYQLGSRLVVNNDSNSNRIGLRLTQQGAIAGAEFSF